MCASHITFAALTCHLSVVDWILRRKSCYGPSSPNEHPGVSQEGRARQPHAHNAAPRHRPPPAPAPPARRETSNGVAAAGSAEVQPASGNPDPYPKASNGAAAPGGRADARAATGSPNAEASNGAAAGASSDSQPAPGIEYDGNPKGGADRGADAGPAPSAAANGLPIAAKAARAAKPADGKAVALAPATAALAHGNAGAPARVAGSSGGQGEDAAKGGEQEEEGDDEAVVLPQRPSSAPASTSTPSPLPEPHPAVGVRDGAALVTSNGPTMAEGSTAGASCIAACVMPAGKAAQSSPNPDPKGKAAAAARTDSGCKAGGGAQNPGNPHKAPVEPAVALPNGHAECGDALDSAPALSSAVAAEG